MTTNSIDATALYLCYDDGGAELVFQLAFDLTNAGFDVTSEKSAHGTSLIDAVHYGIQHYDAVLPVFPRLTTEDDTLLHELANSLHRTDAHTVFPLMLHSHTPQPVIEASSAVNFTHWRDEYRYQQSLDVLCDMLAQQFPSSGEHAPSLHIRYLNTLQAQVGRYKSLLAALSPRPLTNSKPGERHPLHSQSMWGLTANFELTSGTDGEAGTTGYQLPQLVDAYPRCLITGDTGAGKTTALYRLLLETARASQSRPDEFPLPLFIRLAWWTGSDSLENFIRSCWPFSSDPLPLIASGSVQLLVDGLDELPEPFDERWQALHKWLHDLEGPSRIIITCDTATAATLDSGLPIARLIPTEPVRLRQYVNTYLDADAAAQLLTEILPADDPNQQPALLRPAQNALYLAVMVAMTQDIQQPPIPRQPGLLMQRLVESLWQRESYTGRLVETDEVFDALSWLAASMLDDGLTTCATYDYALDRLGSDAILQAGLGSYLLFMSQQRVSFCHPLVRDYFAARYLLHDGVYTRLMRAHFTPGGQRIPWKWDRAIIQCSALADDRDAILRDVAEVNPYLALDCLTSGTTVSEQVQRDAIRRLLAFTAADDRPHLPQIMQLLRQTADSQLLSKLLEELHSDLTHAQAQDKEIEMSSRNLGPGIVQQLIDALRRENWTRRRGAAWSLGKLQETAAIPTLIEALRDENSSVRKEADLALARIGKKALPHLRQFLHDPAPEMRAAVIKVLGRIADENAVADLIACLPDEAWSDMEEVRVCDLAAAALERIGTEDALQAVDSWRHSPPVPRVRPPVAASVVQTAQHATSADDSEDELQVYIDELADDEWQVRRNAAKKLAETRDNRAIPYLLTALEDEDSQVVWTAVRGLERFRGSEVIEGLLRALEHPEHVVVDTAAEALSKFGDEAVPYLIAAINSPNTNVRGNAIEALGSIGNEDAIPHLVDALEDTSTLDREGRTTIGDLAAVALERIGTDKALFALNQWRQQEQGMALPVADDELPDSSPSLLAMDAMSTPQSISAQRAAVLDFLDQLGDGDWDSQQQAALRLREHVLQLKEQQDLQAIERLTSALSKRETVVRWMAAEALAWLGDSSATPALIEALDDTSWNVRLAAVRSLMEIKDPAAIPGLLKVLKDDNQLVRETAAETLGRIGNPAASSGLIAALSDRDSFVRRAAATALGRVGDRAAVPHLLQWLQDDSDYVQWAVIVALGKLRDERAVPGLIAKLDDQRQPGPEEKRMCDIAAEALISIGTDEARSAVDRWRSNST